MISALDKTICPLCKGNGSTARGACSVCDSTGIIDRERKIGLQPLKMAAPWKLPPDMREDYEERAAIKEYCGGLSRDEAEKQAYKEAVDRL